MKAMNIQQQFLHIAKILWKPVTKFLLFILYYVMYELVTLLKVSEAPIHVSVTFVITVSFNFINSRFQIFLFLFLKYVLTLRLILFRLPTLL